MPELQRATTLSLFILYLNTVSGCELFGRFNMPSLFKQGDIMIGGIFPVFNKDVSVTSTFESNPPGVKCARFDLRAFRWAQVMLFAIKEINNDLALLPNISLGYRILNSCSSPTNTLRAALTLASRPEEIELTSPCPPAISALIAEAGSSQSLAVAGTLGPFQVPIVSYFSTCACLSDRAKYPTFFRTIPSDYFQAKALAALVKHFGWQWIGAIQSDNDYGRNGILAFTEELRVSYNVYKAVYAIAHALHQLVYCQPVGEKTVRPCLNISEIQPKQVTDHLQRVNFRNQFGDDVFFDVNGDPPASYDIINWQLIDGQVQHVTLGHFASAANGDHKLSIKEEDIVWRTGKMVPTSVCSNVCPIGTRKAQIKGRPTCCFDCIPCTDGTIANSTGAGTELILSTGAADCTPCPQEYWSNERKDECIPRTTEFLTYHEPMGIALTVVSLLGASLSLATMMIFIHYRETPVIKASNSELSCFLLFSLFLCFLCPLTFIGKPTVWTCMLRHTAFGVTFALCISCVLGKTIVVVTAFKATLPGSKVAGKFGPAQQRIIVCSCTLIQIIICVLWLKLNPPFPDMVFKYSNMKIVLECNTGSEAAFYAVLGYIGLLAIICLVLAFLARKLPDNFNEAKFITFSMLIFCAVWITFIPAYVSSPGKFTVAVEIFAILSSAFGLLLSIFAPKCYIILIKPEKNTKKHVMGKTVNKS
ncbi:extracellular calcium-sensing receptor-like isoform X3 [Dicentrarchus labrax]|uniref:extracellular calcium-sensing receptor-like isoform X3 n=1 Tax=Dicentrarchus labrax TaxID=13489 RepID=UPI0021F5F3DA|nr:extracellular calcium-sensing receptor-like isoform X3 [Dicentrarchus labrax]